MTTTTHRLARADQTKTPVLHTPWWWSGSTASFVTAYTRAVEAGRTAWDLATYLGAPSAADLRRAVLVLRRLGYDLPTPQSPLPVVDKPDWRDILKSEVSRSSLAEVEAKIGIYAEMISRVLRDKPRTQAEMTRVAARVQQVLIDGMPLDASQVYTPRRYRKRYVAPSASSGTIPRTCLKCRRPFLSWGAGNRLCGMCRSSNAHESEYGGLF